MCGGACPSLVSQFSGFFCANAARCIEMEECAGESYVKIRMVVGRRRGDEGVWVKHRGKGIEKKSEIFGDMNNVVGPNTT